MIKVEDYILTNSGAIEQVKEINDNLYLTDSGAYTTKDIICYAKTREVLMPNYQEQYIWLNAKYMKLERKNKNLKAELEALKEENEQLRLANIGMQERLGIKHEEN